MIDSATGKHLWAKRFNVAADGIWDIQDEITGSIVSTLATRITEIEEQRILAKPTDNLEAYEYNLRGQALLEIRSRGDSFAARKLFRRTIALDPNYATAYAGLGQTYLESVLWGWTGSPQKTMEQAQDLAQKALSLDANNVNARRSLAGIYGVRRQHALALIESERLIAINPNDARSFAQQGVALTWMGRPDGAIRALERALHFDPDMNYTYFWHLSLAYYLKERYADAAAILQRNMARHGNTFWDHLLLAAVYEQMGRIEAAERAAAAVRQIDPHYKRVLRFGQFQKAADIERVDVGTRKVGLK